jgi:transcriptional regulator
MSSKDQKTHQVFQGTWDLIVLRNLATIGPQHAYRIATRLQQIPGGLLNLNQGSLYPALVRLEQYGWTKGSWSKTESGREARFYVITVAGQKALRAETEHWRRTSQLMERLLVEGTRA